MRSLFEASVKGAIIAAVSRVRLHRTEAIVLKRHDFGEADRILTLYTPDRGKQRAIAKGVRRITSRKSGHVELFVHAQVLLAEGRNLHVVTQAETVNAFRGLRDDLARASYAYHVAELVDRFVEEDLPSPATFQFLRDTLDELAQSDQPSFVARFFELRFLGLLGYRPELFFCARCGESLEADDNVFSPEAGGVLCPHCGHTHPDTMPMDDAVFRVMRFLQSHEWSDVRRLRLTPATASSLEGLMYAYIRNLLERDLRSIEFLRVTRHLNRPAGAQSDGAPADN